MPAPSRRPRLTCLARLAVVLKLHTSGAGARVERLPRGQQAQVRAAAIVLCTPCVDWGRQDGVREGSRTGPSTLLPPPHTTPGGASSLPPPTSYSKKPSSSSGPFRRHVLWEGHPQSSRQDLRTARAVSTGALGAEACLISVTCLDPTGSAQMLGGHAWTLLVLTATLLILPSPSTTNTQLN